MNATSAQIQYLEGRKSPAIAVILSFTIPGAGQIYNDETGKGIGMIVVYLLCWAGVALIFPFLIMIPLWVWGMFDANTGTKIFNNALKAKTVDIEEVALQKAAAAKSASITSDEFVAQIEKSFRLFQNSLLSEIEFEAKKKEMISILTSKKPAEAPEDFLTAVIPLIQRKVLTEQEISQIKAVVL